jgi:hypothetical protein
VLNIPGWPQFIPLIGMLRVTGSSFTLLWLGPGRARGRAVLLRCVAARYHWAIAALGAGMKSCAWLRHERFEQIRAFKRRPDNDPTRDRNLLSSFCREIGEF